MKHYSAPSSSTERFVKEYARTVDVEVIVWNTLPRPESSSSIVAKVKDPGFHTEPRIPTRTTQ